jgi:anti-anti-sigma factor
MSRRSSRRSRRQWLEIEQIGDVHVAKFNTRHLLDEDKLQGIGDQLLCLGKQAGHQRLILNLEGVQRLSTEVVGKFLTLHRTVKSKGGRLIVCNVHPGVYEVFRICAIPKLLPVYDTEQEALQSYDTGVLA